MEFAETKKYASPPPSEDIGAKCVAAIQEAMSTATLNASGRTSASLGYKQGIWALEIFAEGKHAPIPTLQNSVKPTPRGGNGFLPEILQWVKDKGLTVKQGPHQSLEAAQKAAAQAIYHSIWERGTRRTFPPRKDIYSPALEEAIRSFAEQVAGAITIEAIARK